MMDISDFAKNKNHFESDMKITKFSSSQVSGSALAGPMLQEGSAPENAPPALHMTGEMWPGNKQACHGCLDEGIALKVD